MLDEMKGKGARGKVRFNIPVVRICVAATAVGDAVADNDPCALLRWRPDLDSADEVPRESRDLARSSKANGTL